MPDPKSLDAEIAFLAKRAGFELTPAQIADYREAYDYVRRMSQLIRTPRSYMIEPAHTFSFPVEISK